MAEEIITMSRRELDLVCVIERVARGELSQVEAARVCERSERQVGSPGLGDATAEDR